MKAVGFNAPGGPEVLTVLDLPEPKAESGQIRISVHGAGVNPADVLFRMGEADLSASAAPFIPGMDVAGVVAEIGPDTDTPLRPGDTVMAVVLPVRPEGGGYAEQVVVPASWAVAMPAGISPLEAATVPMNGLTALAAIEVLGLTAGDMAGVTGAAGIFGGYFLQLAAMAGIRTVADAAPSDEPLVRGLGADMVVPRGRELAREIRKLVPDGVAALADSALLGAAALPAVGDGGRYLSLRMIGERGTRPLPSAPRGISYCTVRVHEHFGEAARLEVLRQAVAAGRLTPRVAEVLRPDQAPRAHAALERGGVRGRFVLDFT